MILTLTGAVLAAMIATGAEAHTFGATGAGFDQGFLHPFSGLDHMLAMVAVGLWAAQHGRPGIWALPVAFPAVMAVGGLLGWAGVAVPAVEPGIAASVLVLGLAVAFAVRPPVWIGIALVAVFALFHGHAHGTELPEAAGPLAYGLGFVMATALLHGVGIVARLGPRLAARGAGAAVAASGLALILA
ncbi:MAG: HupE/UreJ family protein [Alphaproteobacteria bacterium]